MKKLKLRVQRVPVTRNHWQARAHIVLGWHTVPAAPHREC